MPTRHLKTKHADGYIPQAVQALDGKSTGTQLTGFGVTRITISSATETASNDFGFRLGPPVCPGIVKLVVVSGASASTKEITVATTDNFFGSSVHSVVFSTAVNNPSDGLLLVGVDAASWALVGRKLSTAASLA